MIEASVARVVLSSWLRVWYKNHNNPLGRWARFSTHSSQVQYGLLLCFHLDAISVARWGLESGPVSGTMHGSHRAIEGKQTH